MTWEPETANPAVGSFMPYLRWAVERTTGPVLELGGGYFSSPYLHELFTGGRPACTYEYDPKWAHELGLRFNQPITSHFDTVAPLEWDVVLVDCEGWNRREFLEALRAKTQVFVVHDSQDPWVPEEVLGSFTYRLDVDIDPRTTLVSNVIDVWRAV
jgi:hypothetical protein